MGFNLQQSFHKLAHYLGSIAKNDIVYQLDGKTITVKAPKKIVVSPNIFRKFRCMQCGKCCKVSFWNCYSEIEYNKLLNLYDVKKDFERKDLVINNTKHNIYVNPHEQSGRCKFLGENNTCNIHKLNPIHCRVPLIKFKYYKTGTTYITKEPYGRNWQFGCPAKLEKELKVSNITADELNTFNRIKQLADEWGIETHIDEIIKFLSTTKIINNKIISNEKTIFEYQNEK